MAELLVSVRSASEARAALAGGAGLIDVKEPARGALGRAGDATIIEVVRAVGGRRPVSAALGELLEFENPGPPSLSYIKWGLAGSAGLHWRFELARAREALVRHAPTTGPVAVAYADWHRARAPTPEEVCAFASTNGWQTLLIDTWQKDGKGLLEWLPMEAVQRLCRKCRQAGMKIALAGSLDAAAITKLQPAGPDWFAVRGAACRESQRLGAVDSGRVRALADLVADNGAASVSPSPVA